jgi:hypothetical protein
MYYGVTGKDVLNGQNMLESSDRRTPENGGVDVDENVVVRCWLREE